MHILSLLREDYALPQPIPLTRLADTSLPRPFFPLRTCLTDSSSQRKEVKHALQMHLSVGLWDFEGRKRLSRMLALQTDYALRTLIFLAGRPRRARISEVAAFFQISENHVAKAVNQLARQGFVRSVRGIGGGIELARPAEQIRVGEVVQAFEGHNLHLLECVATEGVCVIQPNCKLKGVLAKAEQLQLEYLNSVTLADIVQPGGELVELSVPGNSTGEANSSDAS